MSWEAWLLFTAFWAVFVTTPGPNAVNCIQNGMSFGFWRALPGVLAILTQATAFLLLSAAGITALITASPTAFFVAKLIGAAFLIYLGIRGWMQATKPLKAGGVTAKGMYVKALAIATINPKSVAGYLAAFSQFVQPDVPIWTQMWVILPTALTLTTLSYCGFTALGAGLGRSALAAVANTLIRRILAVCFIIYGVLLGASNVPGRA